MAETDALGDPRSSMTRGVRVRRGSTDSIVNMTIIPLADRPDLATVVAEWHFDEWGHLYPGGTFDGRTAALSGSWRTLRATAGRQRRKAAVERPSSEPVPP